MSKEDPAKITRLRSAKREIEGRIFSVDLLKFANGCFANIAEDQTPRLGDITISISTQQGVTSSTLIPERKESIFSKMIGELLAEKTHGLAIVSLYIREGLDTIVMKTLLNDLGKFIEED